jgi:hypothetical protein
VVFGILLRCFTHRPSFLLCCFPPPFRFLESICHFFSTLLGIFESLLGASPFECLEAFLVRQHVAFPISSGGIGLISLKVIAIIAYLRSWALITHVKASKFLLNSCSFLFRGDKY